MVHIAVEMAPICKVRSRLRFHDDTWILSVLPWLWHTAQLALLERLLLRSGHSARHATQSRSPLCAQVGGLGDVVTALGRAVQEQGHTVEVLLPRWAG